MRYMKPQVLSWPEYTVKLRIYPQAGLYRYIPGLLYRIIPRIGQIKSIPE
jgi:hypothetical protein